MKAQSDGINPLAVPSGTGCAECLAAGGCWFNLRRCAPWASARLVCLAVSA
jgi:hypothetical protein